MLIIATNIHANKLTVCYDASFMFKVGESCITYEKDKNKNLVVSSRQYTTGTMKSLYPLEQTVIAYLTPSPLKSKSLFFYEKNKWKTLTHHYSYGEEIQYLIQKVHVKDNKVSTKKGNIVNYNFFDPTAAVLHVQMANNNKDGKLQTFFEGKNFPTSYKSNGYKEIELNDKKINCRIIDFKLPLKSSSMISPSGKWRLFIDKETGIIIKLELLFGLGKAVLTAKSIEGNPDFLKSNIKLN